LCSLVLACHSIKTSFSDANNNDDILGDIRRLRQDIKEVKTKDSPNDENNNEAFTSVDSWSENEKKGDDDDGSGSGSKKKGSGSEKKALNKAVKIEKKAQKLEKKAEKEGKAESKASKVAVEKSTAAKKDLKKSFS